MRLRRRRARPTTGLHFVGRKHSPGRNATPELLADVAIELEELTPDPSKSASPDGQGARHSLTCRYCKTLFFFTPSVAGCPNCGAPAQATEP